MRLHRGKTPRSGFTVVEVLATVVILAVLAIALVPNWRSMRDRAGEAKCIANMRAICLGLHAHLEEHKNVWPQGPHPTKTKEWEDFWLKVLAPYGVTPATWTCPSFDSQLAAATVPREERPKIYYTPTLFGPTPGIATRWSTQPWLIERGNAHGQGALICFPDGSIKSFNKVLAEMGVR